MYKFDNELLKTLLKDNKLSIYKFSKKIDLHNHTVFYIVNGKTINPTISVANKIAKYFNLKVDDFIIENEDN